MIEHHPNSGMARSADRGSWCAWSVFVLCVAVGLARVSQGIEAHWSPFLLFPAIVGSALGAFAAWLGHWLGMARERKVIALVMFAAIVLSLGQHLFAYVAYRDAFDAQLRANPQFVLLQQAMPDVGPPSFSEYLVAEARQTRTLGRWRLSGTSVWFLWGIDAALVTLSACFIHRALRRYWQAGDGVTGRSA